MREFLRHFIRALTFLGVLSIDVALGLGYFIVICKLALVPSLVFGFIGFIIYAVVVTVTYMLYIRVCNKLEGS